MALTKGTVTIDSETGAPSGTGAARAMFNALDATINYVISVDPPREVEGEQLASARQGLADLCNSIAEIIDYIKTNADVDVEITTSDSGLQTGANAGNPTGAPSSTKYISGTVS